ncbi:hypothetical protein L917_10642, partial [Phytophthora nicotianae]
RIQLYVKDIKNVRLMSPQVSDLDRSTTNFMPEFLSSFQTLSVKYQQNCSGASTIILR